MNHIKSRPNITFQHNYSDSLIILYIKIRRHFETIIYNLMFCILLGLIFQATLNTYFFKLNVFK